MRGIALPQNSHPIAAGWQADRSAHFEKTTGGTMVRRRLVAAVLLLILGGPAAADDDEERKFIGMPGYSLTDDLLFADVVRIARHSVPALVKRKTGDKKAGDCKQTDFVDAMITAIGDGDPSKRPWFESWTFRVCERTVHVPIKFSAHAPRPESRCASA
jgi:hypothetical protein